MTPSDYLEEVVPILRLIWQGSRATGEKCHNLFEVGNFVGRFPKVASPTRQPLGFAAKPL
jgi:hypothetical protein